MCYSRWHIDRRQHRSRRSGTPPRASSCRDPTRDCRGRGKARRPTPTRPSPGRSAGRQHQHRASRAAGSARRGLTRDATAPRHPGRRHATRKRAARQGRRSRATRTPARLHPRRPTRDGRQRVIAPVPTALRRLEPCGLRCSVWSRLSRLCTQTVEPMRLRSRPSARSSLEPGSTCTGTTGRRSGSSRSPVRSGIFRHVCAAYPSVPASRPDAPTARNSSVSVRARRARTSGRSRRSARGSRRRSRRRSRSRRGCRSSRR